MIIDLLDEMGVKKDDADLPIILHSFDYDTIKLWKTITDFQTSYLISDFSELPDSLINIKKHTHTLGVKSIELWDKARQDVSSDFLYVRNLGFTLHAWTFRDDALDLAGNFIDQYKIV